MTKPLRAVIAGLAVLASVAASPAQAHTVSVFQLIQTILLGNVFSIRLVGDFSGPPLQPANRGLRESVQDPEIVVDELGIAVSWDPGVIDVFVTDTLNPPWDTTVIRQDRGVTTLVLKSSAGTDNELFPVAHMLFAARGLGSTDVVIDTTSGDCATERCGVFSYGTELPTEFVNGSVTVVASGMVPVPAGFWLFVSGLLGLASFARKHAWQGFMTNDSGSH